MSIHKSLKSGSVLQRPRNVLKRAERIAILKEQGKFTDEETSVFNLPKVKGEQKLKKGKKK